MPSLLRVALPIILILPLTACGSKAEKNAPLAFVPADTPYVFANLAPPSESLLEARLRLVQSIWKPYSKMLDLAEAKAKDDKEKRAIATVRILLDEFKGRDSLDKFRELGFNPRSLGAIYAVGLIPVIRGELADAAAFRALIARIEAKIGEKLVSASVAGQPYWRLGPAEAPVFGILAIENDTHLVATLAPKNASEATLRALLGLDRPTKSLSDVDILQKLGKERGYLPQGIGYVDVTRLLDLLVSEPHGVDAEFAAALATPTTAIDAICHQEIAAIGAKMPRLTFGIQHMNATRDEVVVELELDTTLRQQLAATTVPVSGLGVSDAVPLDFAMSLPVLKLKDFWLKQANAVAASPFQCTRLAKLNETFAEMKENLDRTIPPPLSNILGLRFTLDKLALGSDGMPDPTASAMRMLVASDNPLLIVNMAQLTAPQLKDFKLTLDGQPVALPTGELPLPLAVFAAANNGALAIAAGANAETALPPYLTANAGDGKTFLRVHIGSEFYTFYGQLLGHFASLMPQDGRELTDSLRELYAHYGDWFASSELRVGLNERGVQFTGITQYKIQ